MSFDKMSFDKMSFDKMSFDKMSFDHMARDALCRFYFTLFDAIFFFSPLSTLFWEMENILAIKLFSKVIYISSLLALHWLLYRN
jgi:hypothetical protein